MRFLCALVSFSLLVSAHAAIEKDSLFGVSVNLPDSAGWKATPKENLPQPPNIKFLSFAQHEAKAATFALCIVQNLPSKSLTDPKTLQALETMLTSLQYKFIGNSTVTINNRAW